jgi:hypothetical protein
MKHSPILALCALLVGGSASAAVAQSAPSDGISNPAMPAPVNATAPMAPMQNGTPLAPDARQALTAATKTYFEALHQLGPKKLQSFEAIVAPNYHLIFPNGTTWDASRVIAWATTNNINSSGLVENLNVKSAMSSGNSVVATVDAAGSVVQAGNDNLGQYRSGSSSHTMTWMQIGGKWQLVEDRITQSSQSPNNTTGN